MKIWFDAEFEENGRTIELISLGAIREDGLTFYAESAEYDRIQATTWLREYVIPLLGPSDRAMSRAWIAENFRSFAGSNPEFWAWYGSYDWVVLCQLYGRMLDIPKDWPFLVRDLKQLALSLGDPEVPPNHGREHHALDDAIHARDIHSFLNGVKAA